jgi:hypothetical protein
MVVVEQRCCSTRTPGVGLPPIQLRVVPQRPIGGDPCSQSKRTKNAQHHDRDGDNPATEKQWHAKPVHQEFGGYGDDNGNCCYDCYWQRPLLFLFPGMRVSFGEVEGACLQESKKGNQKSQGQEMGGMPLCEPDGFAVQSAQEII